MATHHSTVDYLVEQMSAAGRVTQRKMFGEYAIYCDEKLIALVCDDQLFIKPTAAGRAYLGDVIERPPYPGAKPSFWIDGEHWETSDWLTELVRLTASELSLPVKTPRKRA